MMAWTRHCLAGALLVALPSIAAGAPSRASSGYAEVTAPDQTSPVAIVAPPAAVATGYAIVASPAPAATGNVRHVTVSLPDGPPTMVEIRFDRRRSSAARADAVAATLQQQGITVLAVGPASSPVSDGVGFVFAEDEMAAADIVRRLPAPLSRATPVRIDAHALADPAPGTIEITLGGDRRTS